MGIIVVDFSPEIFWFVSNSLAGTEIGLKHIPDIKQAEQIIYQELPSIVVLNADDPRTNTEQFIGRMRNHVFARNTVFIVFTSNPSPEFRRGLVIQGAAQVFYRSENHQADPKLFSSTINWILEYKEKEPQYFDEPMVPFSAEAEFSTWGRIGWLSSTQCLVETNLDLNPGDSIEISNPLFEELGMKNVEFVCNEKNKVGRYYQYANSLLGHFRTKNNEKDIKTLKNWIDVNGVVSKSKPVKLVYFESDPVYREEITKMIKLDKRYCARGYSSIDHFSETLNYQIPNLVLINRNLIQKDKQQFDAIKKFITANPCYVITYALDDILDIKEFKKNYEFAMHVDRPLEGTLLETMIAKLEAKLPKEDLSNTRVVFNKHSPNSRIAFHCPCIITELSHEAIQIRLPVLMSLFCSCEISSHQLSVAQIGRVHLFRSIKVKKNLKNAQGYPHKVLFVGINQKEKKAIDDTIEDIKNPKELDKDKNKKV